MPSTTRINDLEILLKVKDQTQKAFNNTKNNLSDIDKLAKIGKRTLIGLGASAGLAFTKLADHGALVAQELQRMGVLLGTGTREADALYSVIRDQNPSADIEGLSDGVLTLAERFSEARVATGELFGFAEDFGVDFDNTVSGAREQTAEFLRFLQKLPTENDRVTASIAVMGDEGARQFNALIRDADKLQQTIDGLATEIDDIPDIYSDEDAKQIDEYIAAQKRLEESYDDLSKTAFTFVDGPLTKINNRYSDILDLVNDIAIDAKTQFSPNGLFGIIFGDQSNDDILNSVRSPLDGVNLGTGGDINLDLGADATEKGAEILRRRNEKILAEQAKIDRENEAAEEKERERREQENLKRITREKEEEQKVIDDLFKKNQEEQRRLEEIDQEREAERTRKAEEEKRAREIRKFDAKGAAVFGLNDPTDRFSTNTPDRLSNGEISDFEKMADELAQSNLLETSIGVADAIASMSGAISDFSDTFFNKGSKAFKAFKNIQIVTATAAAYSAAAQALADFSSLSFVDKIARGAQVLSIGLSYVAQIKRLNASGGSGGNGGGSQGSSSQFSGAPQTPFQQQINDTSDARQEVNVYVQSRARGSVLFVDEFEDILEEMTNLPGSPIYRVRESV